MEYPEEVSCSTLPLRPVWVTVPCENQTAFSLAKEPFMVKRPSVSASVQKAPSDGDGHAIANKILLSLPRKEYDQVLSKLEFVRRKLHPEIHEAGESFKNRS